MSRDEILFDVTAERAVLGALLMDGDAITAATEKVAPSDFSRDNGLIFRRMIDLHGAGIRIDHFTVISELRQRGELQKLGGEVYILSLTDGMPRGANIGAYAEIVSRAAERRRLLVLLEKYRNIAESNGGNVAEIAEKFGEELTKFSKPKASAFAPPAHWQMLDGAKVREWACDPLVWIIEDIVALGNLVFVAAESQCGKTLIGLYIAVMMLRGGRLFGEFPINPVGKVLYLVLEDPPRRIKDRLLDMEREGDPVIEEGRLVFYVAPGLAISDDLHFIYLEELIQRERFDVVFLDTYQRATPGVDSSNDERQSLILHKIADLTRKLGVTLWVHDHFRKTLGGRKRGVPNLNDIKGTGGKAQNADAFLLMDRTGSRLRIQGSSKDSDKPIGFYVDIAPQGVTDQPKFTYAGTIGEIAASARDKKARNIESVGKHWRRPETGRSARR